MSFKVLRSWMIFFVLYLAIGAVIHLAFLGPVINVASILGWSLLLVWPVWAVVSFMLAAFFTLLAVVAVVWAGGLIAAYRERRIIRERRKAFAEIRNLFKS